MNGKASSTGNRTVLASQEQSSPGISHAASVEAVLVRETVCSPIELEASNGSGPGDVGMRRCVLDKGFAANVDLLTVWDLRGQEEGACVDVDVEGGLVALWAVGSDAIGAERLGFQAAVEKVITSVEATNVFSVFVVDNGSKWSKDVSISAGCDTGRGGEEGGCENGDFHFGRCFPEETSN